MSSAAQAAPAVPGASATPLRDTGMLAPTGPWWRHPMMWLVVGGPSAVVVASFITLALAIRHADPVVEHGSQAGSAHVSAEDAGTQEAASARGAGQDRSAALQPAMRARNHAATGGQER